MTTPSDFFANLELVGGFRVNPDQHRASSLGYPWGGFTARYEAERGLLHCLIQGITHTRATHYQRHFVNKMSPADVPIEQWQMLVSREYIEIDDIFAPGDGVLEDGYQVPQGLWMDDDKGIVRMVTTRSRYKTHEAKDPKHWIAKLENGVWKKYPCSLPAQAFGGGIMRLPQAIADEYFDGRTLVLGCGGSESGQEAVIGPTFAIVDENFKSPKILLNYATTAEVGIDRPGTWDKVAPGFPDYHGGPGDLTLQGWVHEVRIIDGVPTGRFASGSIRGGCGTLIDFEGVRGIAYMVRCPLGVTTYQWQTECLSEQYHHAIYFYPLSELARVYRGEIKPWQTQPVLIRWTRGRGVPRGLYWDAHNKLLWVYTASAWTTDNTPESYPIVAAYRVKTGTPTPDPEPEPIPTPEPEPPATLEERVAKLEAERTTHYLQLAELQIDRDNMAHRLADAEERINAMEESLGYANADLSLAVAKQAEQLEALATAVDANDAKVAELRSHFDMNDAVLAEHVDLVIGLKQLLNDA